ncbi:MAG: endopeptidase La [Elusimicrobia bacterium]|nr:endopeptidase La [Elusimicrobiota bacterium]
MSPSPKSGVPKLPLLAVRDVVLFPHMTLPLSVGREKSIKALEAALAKHDKRILVCTQRQATVEDPGVADLFPIGVEAETVQCLKMPDGTLKVLLQGLRRARAAKQTYSAALGYWEAECDPVEELGSIGPESQALKRHVVESFEKYGKLSRRITPEAIAPLVQIEDPSRLADTIAASAIVKIAERQDLLETTSVVERLHKLDVMLNAEIEILNVEKKIHADVRKNIEKTQKEYYLTEQMKAIQKELRQKDDFGKELDELRDKIKEAKMSKAGEEASLKELGRLEKMMPFSPEATVCRSYLDWMIGLPWAKTTKDSLDLKSAEKILNEDHFGLEKAKERVLEYLAVCKLTKSLKGPILCFVGPPGVGKTSLAKSISRAMGRKFTRMSLGGVRDEAEIRGHRRTYIGSLPGRLVQSLRKAGSRNPVFLLDEIDKMGMDWRGDPAAALLEVLDPEQNSTFMDHYLDVEFDLSQIMFVCTANTLEGIPVSLQDRLEILRFPGYTHREKVSIAKGHLIPKQLKDHGVPLKSVDITEAALNRTMQEYAREAGVRSLEREIASMARKAARIIVQDKTEKITIDASNLEKFLGIPKYHHEKNSHNDVGVATGLAWTEHGGEILAIEAVALNGKGILTLTGKLGSVMQESAHAALSFIKSIAKILSVPPSAFKGKDIHIHVPEGAIPKDGPSAGIAIATAVASLVSGRPVKPGVAMTGEITLRGRVLPIGGLKEKVMAAHREGLKTVLFPMGNLKDVEEIPKEIQAGIELVPVKDISEVLRLALLPIPPKTKQKSFSWAPPRAEPRIITGLPRPGAA